MKGGHGVYIFDKPWQGCTRSEPIYHPTQKPTTLMIWCLEKRPKSNSILDPFMGSGTTLVAAKNLGRHAIGIEIEEGYCEIAAKRLEQEVFDFGEPAQPQPEQMPLDAPLLNREAL